MNKMNLIILGLLLLTSSEIRAQETEWQTIESNCNKLAEAESCQCYKQHIIEVIEKVFPEQKQKVLKKEIERIEQDMEESYLKQIWHDMLKQMLSVTKELHEES